MEKIEITTKLRILRKERKLTQEQVAQELGLKRATYGNYELGRRSPSLKELAKIAEFYGVGLDYFGVDAKNEVNELLARAQSVFISEEIPKEDKEAVYKALIRLYMELQE